MLGLGPEKRGLAGYHDWCLKHFSGVLCVDEVHEGPRHILFATDPLLDATVAWDVVEKCDGDAVGAFLDAIQGLGFTPRVVISDGSPLYKESLVERWASVEHQLCVFHVLAEINKDVLQAARAFRDRLPKPKRYRRGRPCKRGRPRKKDDRRAFVTEHLHLLVKRRERFTPKDEAHWQRMAALVPDFQTLKRFVDDVHRLFNKNQTQTTARWRRTRLANDPAFAAVPQLARATRRLAPEKFEKMIVFLGYGNLDRTNNHVERGNRSFRMLQKTRYRRRRTRTILLALKLHLLRRWRQHPLYAAERPSAKRLRRRPKRPARAKKKAA